MKMRGANHCKDCIFRAVVKEKTDRLDAQLIARYAWLYRQELIPSSVKSMSHLELGRLLALRDQIVRNNAGLKGTLKEMKVLLSSPTTDFGCISLKRSIDYLSKQVKAIETRIKEILSEDVLMSKNYELLTSLKGFGLVVACQLIYHTGNFTKRTIFSGWDVFRSQFPLQTSSISMLVQRAPPIMISMVQPTPHNLVSIPHVLVTPMHSGRLT